VNPPGDSPSPPPRPKEHTMPTAVHSFTPPATAPQKPPAQRLFSDPRHGPLPALLLCLTAVTGLVDAVSLLQLGRVFVANMTGNIVFTGFAIVGAAGILPQRTAPPSPVKLDATYLRQILHPRHNCRSHGASRRGPPLPRWQAGQALRRASTSLFRVNVAPS
jgi:hypothetical protein